MEYYCFVLFVTFGARAVELGVEGEVSFSFRHPRDRFEPRAEEDAPSAGPRGTEAPVVECVYQLPEQAQVRALLGNMMNELTRMFVNVQEMSGGETHMRHGETRFRVVSKKNTRFFENIYSNMTEQYLDFYNSTAEQVARSGRNKDPCEHQSEMKQLWKDLIDNSLSTFRRAAFECVEQHLQEQGKAGDARTRARLRQFLARELGNIRMNQLELLCDQFQLCYYELIRRGRLLRAG